MKVLAINATYRAKGTTTRLTEAALEGAASKGADTEMVLLRERDIRWCNNCLKCYGDLDSSLAPCSLDDDMTAILEAVQQADGVIFASPIHNGFISGLMTLFFERLVWRMCKPTGDLMGLKGLPEPRTDKVRAVASIVSAGGMPEKLRKYCDGTPWVKENSTQFLNGFWVGDLYAAAHLERRPVSADDWASLYHLRKLSPSQLRQAHELGESVAETIDRGDMRPTSSMSGITSVVIGFFIRFMKLYKTTDDLEK